MIQLEDVIVDFCGRLTSAGIQYLIGGSVAAGVWGEPRQTNDVDLEVYLSKNNKDAFVEVCRPPYLLSSGELEDAITKPRPFTSVQVLQTEVLWKLDCFLVGSTAMDAEAYDKSKIVEIRSGAPLRFACAEHILVQKMRWYHLGNRASERQWRDMSAIVRITDVDWSLVERWAGMFGLGDLVTEMKAVAAQ